MYLITNRALSAESGGLEIFGSMPNAKGANELRIVEVTGRGSRAKAKALPDVVSKTRVRALKKTFDLSIDENAVHYRSLEMACVLFSEACRLDKHLLFYVHGYNNDVEAIIDSVHELEKQYPDVLVVPFTWPAKGGGVLSGTPNYLNDKRDARASSGALDRVIEHTRKLHLLITESRSESLWREVMSDDKFDQNPEAARIAFVEAQAKACKVTINLLCHSMGNYVLKYATLPSGSHMRSLVFDNVCLVAADVNNHDHANWVSRIEARGGVYIVINENDYALQWSRRKPGEEQKERLGHYLRKLNSPNAVYLDLTRATSVGDDHGYFSGDAPKKNRKLLRLFSKLFTGERPERYTSQMEFMPSLNAYRLK